MQSGKMFEEKGANHYTFSATSSFLTLCQINVN